ncbi:SDR family NAD(P)-dependent oxidoreductase [Streptomyces fuscichromogenes]|uniref:Glucose 1-dehydrogenase n=1 Tax=Streptomyces fuscichromogenes TaxID=1324013 RepID=A0A917XFC6_9ACTN|nr:SDR family oxidoreductase [Streptomyces fuscichromogenes]GGN20145.1 glucose 1-dehydrogenase [Streptomyces fuscichromogenes]
MSDSTAATPDVPHQAASLQELLDLRGAVALVTGAGQGVGATVARYLSAQGAAVAVNDYRLERAEEVAAKIRAEGGNALAFQADVTDFAAVQAMVSEVAESLGPVSVLVNNAGNAGAGTSVPDGRPFWESDPADWEPFLAVNLNGVLNCSRAVVPSMVENRHGRLITVISDAGRVGEAGMEAYSAAKAGAAGLMRSLARSLGRHQITANCVAIGFTNTPAVAQAVENPELSRKVLGAYIIRRVGEPSDAAGMVTYLASPAGSWITGQTYPVNGGFSVNQ